MTDSDLLSHYTRAARVFAAAARPLVEVIIHDYRKPKHSVVAVFNNHITNRQVGDPVTSLGADRLNDKDVNDELLNYESTSPDGRPLKSCSLAIRNESGKLIGALCLNADISMFQSLETIARVFVETSKRQNDIREELAINPETRNISYTIKEYVRQKNRIAKKLNVDERLDLLRHLEVRGLLLQKAAVSTIARELGITRQTVHRTLRSLKERA